MILILLADATSPHSIFDVLWALIVGIPSIIAAISSLKNGRRIDDNGEKLDHNTNLTADIKTSVNGAAEHARLAASAAADLKQKLEPR